MKIQNLNTNQLNQNGYTKNMQTKGKIGALFAFPISHTPDDCLSCDGYSLLIIDYKDLFKVIGKIFNQENDPEDSFRVPDYNITGRFLQPGTQVGNLIAAGLPNITGVWTPKYGWIDGATYSGAFTAVKAKQAAGSGSTATLNYGINFNASRSSSVYGNSTTVQPPAQIVHICIKYK